MHLGNDNIKIAFDKETDEFVEELSISLYSRCQSINQRQRFCLSLF